VDKLSAEVRPQPVKVVNARCHHQLNAPKRECCSRYDRDMDVLHAVIGVIWVWLAFLTIPFGLPGNWLMAACALIPLGEEGYIPLAVMLAAAGIAELSELLLGSKMASKAGASKAGMFGSFLGALLGGIFLTFLIPIPIVGTLVGACAGAFLGALIFELVFAKRDSTSGGLMKIGVGASLGVLFGRVVKISLGAASAIYWTLAAINSVI
jgi:uncharacterized protein